MYEVMWIDLELDEMEYTITTEKGLKFLLDRPEQFNVYWYGKVRED